MSGVSLPDMTPAGMSEVSDICFLPKVIQYALTHSPKGDTIGAKSVAKPEQASHETQVIINENHYREVVERICAAESSIRMMTANFKR